MCSHTVSSLCLPDHHQFNTSDGTVTGERVAADPPPPLPPRHFKGQLYGRRLANTIYLLNRDRVSYQRSPSRSLRRPDKKSQTPLVSISMPVITGSDESWGTFHHGRFAENVQSTHSFSWRIEARRDELRMPDYATPRAIIGPLCAIIGDSLHPQYLVRFGTAISTLARSRREGKIRTSNKCGLRIFKSNACKKAQYD